MTDKEKSEELASLLVGEDQNQEPLVEILMEMAQWKEQQMRKNSIEREVKIDAGGYPYIDCNIEFYDYYKDVPLAKKGDKVKIIVIHGEE